MTKTNVIGVRVTPDEHKKVRQLAAQANTTPSEVLRALVRAAECVRPVEATVRDWTQPAQATITDSTPAGADRVSIVQG